MENINERMSDRPAVNEETAREWPSEDDDALPIVDTAGEGDIETAHVDDV